MVGEVDAYPPLPVLFLNNDQVSQPFWILNLDYQPGFEELINFVVDGFGSFWSQFPLFLFDGLIRWVGVELVSGNIRVDSSHVFQAPCEGQRIFFEESD